MQEQIKSKSGRPKGKLSYSTYRKMAIEVLKEAVMNEAVPEDIRAKAALRLLEEEKNNAPV